MMIVDGGGPHDERFETVYRKHYARVWHYFRANRIADDEAHDLAQDTFKRVFEHFGGIRNDDPGAFIATVARTILLNRIRTRGTLKRSGTMIDLDDPELLFEPPAPPEPDYAEQATREAQLVLVRDAMATLPDGQRQCLRLWIEGFKYDEIAKILGTTTDAVKSRLRDAKRALRAQLGVKP